MGSRKIALALVSSVTAAVLTAGTATASTEPSAPEPEPGADEFAAGLEAAEGGPQSSPYVQADSPEQAVEILNALESPQTASPSALAAASSVNFGPCTLDPHFIYQRTSGGIGAKPATSCEVPVTSIRQDTDLKYHWGLWWWTAKSYPGPGNKGQKSYVQRNVQWQCQGTDSTTWAGTTVGTIVYGGETFYARVYQPQTEKECGA